MEMYKLGQEKKGFTFKVVSFVFSQLSILLFGVFMGCWVTVSMRSAELDAGNQQVLLIRNLGIAFVVLFVVSMILAITFYLLYKERINVVNVTNKFKRKSKALKEMQESSKTNPNLQLSTKVVDPNSSKKELDTTVKKIGLENKTAPTAVPRITTTVVSKPQVSSNRMVTPQGTQSKPVNPSINLKASSTTMSTLKSSTASSTLSKGSLTSTPLRTSSTVTPITKPASQSSPLSSKVVTNRTTPTSTTSVAKKPGSSVKLIINNHTTTTTNRPNPVVRPTVTTVTRK